MDVVKVVLGFYKNGHKDSVIDCTNDLRNWDDVTISLTRSDYTGVVRSISSKFEFVGETKDKIEAFYEWYYLGTQIKVNIYQINESWKYDLIFQGDLDFSTLEIDERVLSINAKDNTLSSIIKANKSTKYDIPTSEVRADKKLKYDRMRILNRVQFTTDDANEDTNEPYKFKITAEFDAIGINETWENKTYFMPIPLAYMSSETYRCPFEYKDQSFEVIEKIDNENIPGIIKAEKNSIFRINTKFKCKLTNAPNGDLYVIIGRPGYGIVSQQINSVNQEIQIELNAPITNGEGVYGVYLMYYRTSGIASKIELEYYAPSEKDGYYTRGSIAYVECFGRGTEIDYNCIDINKLANTLTRKIHPTANVEIDTLPTQCVLVSGEDMRELNTAKISTSFNDFVSFMETCFGFTYTITDNTIRFGRREDLFKNEVVKVIENYSNVTLAQDTSLIYSKVKCGYAKQDYDNTNGKNEFNATIEYDTNVNLTDGTLDLTSPYRADSYGFEFKTQEIENETEDKTFSLEDEDKDKVDSGIFIIEVVEKSRYYVVKREYPSFVKCNVLSSSEYIGIKDLYITEGNTNYLSSDGFANYYLTALSFKKDGADAYLILRISALNSVRVEDESASFDISIKKGSKGDSTHITSNAIITIDWDYVNNITEFDYRVSGNVLKYPISYSCYKRDPFNYGLNPRECVLRNQFMYLPCAQELKFASSEGSTNVRFLVNGTLVGFGDNLRFGGRDMTVNKLSFITSDTALPTTKDGLVEINVNGKVYRGWIVNANQNIGKNEPSEYELILSKR